MLTWRVTRKDILFFVANGGVTVVVAALGVLLRKNNDDVGVVLRRMTFTTTHVTDLTRVADGFVFRLTVALTLCAVALGLVGFTPASLAAGLCVLLVLLFILVFPTHFPTTTPSFVPTTSSVLQGIAFPTRPPLSVGHESILGVLPFSTLFALTLCDFKTNSGLNR